MNKSSDADVSDPGKAPSRAALVVGAGVSGIKTALDLAEAGVAVFLADRRPHLGGTLSQLDKQFPNNHCGMCRALPSGGADRGPRFCLRREVYHENVTLLPSTVLVRLDGEAGAFEAELERQPTGVDPDRCIACGRCPAVCPVEVPDEFSEGLSKRKAVYVRSPLAVPNVYAIDWKACTRCGACVKACPTDAISLDERPSRRTLPVGAVVLTAGFEEFTASLLGEFGHHRWKNVLTGIEFERLLSQATPGGGTLRRPSDGRVPKRIAFLQCIGSRDCKRPYCSSACCMFALKEGFLAREADPSVEPHVFAMDFRAFGKGYHRYLEDARAAGVRLRRGRVPAVRENPATGDLELAVAGEDGKRRYEMFDLVVLSTGFTPPPGGAELLRTAGVKETTHGFCATLPLAPADTSRPGVYVAGPLSEPKDIPDSMTQACAAVARVLSVVGVPAPPTPTAAPAPAAQAAPAETRPARAAVILCGCGGETGAPLDLEGAAQEFRGKHGVAFAEAVKVLCSGEAATEAVRRAAAAGADRVLFGACVPYRFAAAFRKAAAAAGIDPGLVETVNLREGVAWVHEGPAAKRKARDLLDMSLARLLLERSTPVSGVPSLRDVVVAGGGIAGLTAACALADAGFPVLLVEKSEKLGGPFLDPPPSLEPGDSAALVRELVRKAERHERIRIHTQSEWVSLEGCAGDFSSRIHTPSGDVAARHGAGIVAIGGTRLEPTEFLRGSHPRSVTHLDFAKRLASGATDAKSVRSAVFFLCAGLRCAQRSWCGRTCCSETLGAAERLLDANPKAAVWIFQRDVMTYGFLEEGYRRLREKGALFVRFEPGSEPRVRPEGEGILVEARDPGSGADVKLRPDWVVVAAGWGPPDGSALAQALGVELDGDGFFREADVKFRPVDFLKDGLFVAGLAHSPRNVGETISSGLAAAGRAMSLLAKGTLDTGPGMVSEVDARRCSGCEACVEACPYGARFKDEDAGVVVVREALCQGCGACASACPSEAAKLRGFKRRQVFEMIDAALGG